MHFRAQKHQLVRLGAELLLAMEPTGSISDTTLPLENVRVSLCCLPAET